MISLSILMLAAASVLLCGGKLSNLAKTPFRMLPLIFIGAVLSPLIRYFPVSNLTAYFFNALKYLLLIIALFANLKYAPLSFFVLPGTFLNAVVILINYGRMPVHLPESVSFADVAKVEALKAGELSGYLLQTNETLLPFLGDVIHLYAFGQWIFISIGDILLMLGSFLFILRAMKGDYVSDKPAVGKPPTPDMRLSSHYRG